MQKKQADSKNVILGARRIARRDLQSCCTGAGIIAGPHHFVDLWARDSLFATFGIFSTSDFPVFRKTIESFLQFQRSDGLIPYRVMRSRSTLGKYFGKPTMQKKLSANYYSHMSLGLVPDGGLMIIISAALYVERSHDITWLRRVYQSLVQSIDWYEKKFTGGLISEWFQCEWADGVLKSGKTLYTNALYVKALNDMVFLSRKVKNAIKAKHYHNQYIRIKNVFHLEFWNGSYFSDWIDWKRQNYFASHANFLAIIFGLTSKKESESILSYAKAHSMNSFTLHNTYPSYPFWRIPVVQALAGVPDYHNRGVLWLQPGITYALALYRSGQKHAAREWCKNVAAHIVKYNGVFEVYEASNGTPLNRRFYHTEGPFAWSAGLFLWAAEELFRF